MARPTQDKREAFFLKRTTTYLFNLLEQQGLSQQEIEDQLYLGPFNLGGDATGVGVSRKKKGNRSTDIVTLDKYLRTFIVTGAIPKQPDPQSLWSQILFGSVGGLEKVDSDTLVKQHVKFARWAKHRKLTQLKEHRLLRTRVKAVLKAVERLIMFLNTIDGAGHDGWDCAPELPCTLVANYVNEAGHQLGWLKRDALIWLLRATVDNIARIRLDIGYEHGCHASPERAGCYHPRPAPVPDIVLERDMDLLGLHHLDSKQIDEAQRFKRSKSKIDELAQREAA